MSEFVSAHQEDLERMRKFAEWNERSRIINLIRETYNKPELEEYGAFVFSEDIVELIQGKSNESVTDDNVTPE